MKILYAIQGTGNGHLSRARHFVPILKKKGEVDVLISGNQADIDLQFEVKYRFHGISFVFGIKGGIDFYNTYRNSNMRKFMKEVRNLPVGNYNLVISDFEPVSSWACSANNIPCIGLSNQAAVLAPEAPKPKKEDIVGKFILNHYAPCTTTYGFHFQRYNENIYPPVIRDEVRKLKVSNMGHYTVYLPAYSDEKIVKFLSKLSGVQWQVFSKKSKSQSQIGNITIRPINNKDFLQSMASCKGVFCAAGFATPTEALFLKKRLLVVPQKNQYEQQCNASALKEMGVPIIKKLKEKHLYKVEKWIKKGKVIEVDYPDMAEEMINNIITNHYYLKDNYITYLSEEQFLHRPAV